MPPVTPDRISLPDRYRVVRHLANGGMASVWEAHDELLDRDVAVKLLASHLGEDERARRRFQREARAAAGLSSHPNVVTIYDVGEHQSRVFMVMEIMRGGTLGDRLKSGREIPHETALRWLREAAGGARHRPRRRRRAPRHQARQPAARRPRAARGRRLRDRPPGLGGPAHRHRPGARHRRLPVARAGDGRGRDRRVGPLRARGRRLRAADRLAAVRGRALRRAGARPRRGPAAAGLRRAPRSCPRAVDAVLERGLAKEPGGPLAERRGVRRRARAHARRATSATRPTRRLVGARAPATPATAAAGDGRAPRASRRSPPRAAARRCSPASPRSSCSRSSARSRSPAAAATARSRAPQADARRRPPSRPRRRRRGDRDGGADRGAHADRRADRREPTEEATQEPSGEPDLEAARAAPARGLQRAPAPATSRPRWPRRARPQQACGSSKELSPCGYALFEEGAALNGLGQPGGGDPDPRAAARRVRRQRERRGPSASCATRARRPARATTSNRVRRADVRRAWPPPRLPPPSLRFREAAAAVRGR